MIRQTTQFWGGSGMVVKTIAKIYAKETMCLNGHIFMIGQLPDHNIF